MTTWSLGRAPATSQPAARPRFPTERRAIPGQGCQGKGLCGVESHRPVIPLRRAGLRPRAKGWKCGGVEGGLGARLGPSPSSRVGRPVLYLLPTDGGSAVLSTCHFPRVRSAAILPRTGPYGPCMYNVGRISRRREVRHAAVSAEASRLKTGRHPVLRGTAMHRGYHGGWPDGPRLVSMRQEVAFRPKHALGPVPGSGGLGPRRPVGSPGAEEEPLGVPSIYLGARVFVCHFRNRMFLAPKVCKPVPKRRAAASLGPRGAQKAQCRQYDVCDASRGGEAYGTRGVEARGRSDVDACIAHDARLRLSPSSSSHPLGRPHTSCRGLGRRPRSVLSVHPGGKVGLTCSATPHLGWVVDSFIVEGGGRVRRDVSSRNIITPPEQVPRYLP